MKQTFPAVFHAVREGYENLREFFDHHTASTTVKGIIGTVSTAGGLYTSTMPKLEAWLRIISLIIGIAVGVASFVSICWHKKKHK